MGRTLLSAFFLFFLLLGTVITGAAQSSRHHATSSGSAPDQYIEMASELSSRARANVYFKNPQSIFAGAQFSFVNVGQGNITFLRRDLVASGRIPLVLARVYDSSSQGSQDLGPGWLLSATERIIVENGSAKLFTENGSIISFLQGPDGHSFQLENDYPSDYLTLEQTDSSTITATLRTGFVKRFTHMGTAFRLVKVTDRNGNQVTLSYQGGLLSKLENANHFIQFIRDSSGRVTAAQDDSQRTVHYSYDTSGRLIEVDDFGGNAWTYTYTSNNQLQSAIDPLKHANFGLSYDDAGRVKRLELPSGSIKYKYDAEDGLTTVIDRKQLITRFFQNSEGITTRVVNPLGEETAIALDGARNVISLSRDGAIVEKMSYDEEHRLISRHSGENSNNVGKTYSYDAVTGLLAGITSSNGHNETFAYDTAGNITAAKIADGQHEYKYSPTGDLIRVTNGSSSASFSPTADGLFALMTQPGYGVTSFQYKAGGQLSAATFPKGGSVSYGYWPSGLRWSFKLSNKSRAEYSYDAAGNLTGSQIFDAKGKQINGQDLQMNESYQLVKWTLFDGTVTNFQYDPNGNLTIITRGSSTTRFDYDSLNRLIAVTTPEGHRFTYSYEPGERSVIDQYQHSKIVVEDLRDSGLTFGDPLQLVATRPLYGVFGSVRLSEELGTFELSNSDGREIARPQANIDAALEKLVLVSSHMTAKALRAGFNIPFNSMFIPAEYASINCCPECFYGDDGPDCPPCTGGDNNAPSLTSISPSSAAANAGNVAVTLVGGFNDANENVIISGSGVSANPNPAPVDADGNVDTNFQLANSVVAGNYNVSVSDSGGVSNSVTFSVTPVISTISPPRGEILAQTTVTLSGAGFQSGATSVASPNVAVSSLSVSSSTQLTASFQPNGNSGSGNQNVTATVNGLTSSSASFYGQVPIGDAIVQTLSNGPNTCPSGQAGWSRSLAKILIDQESPAQNILNPGTLVTETVVPGFPNAFNITSFQTGSTDTNSNGQFQDTIAFCSSLCPGSTGETAATQTFRFVPPNGGSTIPGTQQNNIVIKCNSITINGQ